MFYVISFVFYLIKKNVRLELAVSMRKTIEFTERYGESMQYKI
jgi:hypothetical protein